MTIGTNKLAWQKSKIGWVRQKLVWAKLTFLIPKMQNYNIAFSLKMQQKVNLAMVKF
jgi:hypothetical protein